MIEGAVILLVGLVAGWVARGARRREKVEKVAAATCACEHVRSMHLDGKGRCAEVDVDSYWEYDDQKGASVRRHKNYPCSCQVYDGPEPLTTMYLPEVEG